MSDLMASTGASRLAICRCCGIEVRQSQYRGLSGTEIWPSVEHDAPCGLPCFGGGAAGKAGLTAYRSGQMHGLKNRHCPRCGPPPETP